MIRINLDVMMAKRKMSLNELSEKVGITPANLSILKNEKGKAIRFSTLDALCNVLDCQPGDLLEYMDEEELKDDSM
ncbi:helix-turn-helix transcriptional regulator [Gracilibacillus sp. S3-1-1]|uniref:Helix-turn-helix transcriptional regulator n=1 Tax=Gracilibacillus pellucidus TaxID=3095368 RepID=A0ACC6M420_9BACI|nr:helix-turn-helix transcriptional regulator [Gracilibacillus sp. S3-1-1]MDX8045620.1 helix-turn-helix transcriptional regulator [Gracilibacillus sp. S3-1-1]